MPNGQNPSKRQKDRENHPTTKETPRLDYTKELPQNQGKKVRGSLRGV